MSSLPSSIPTLATRCLTNASPLCGLPNAYDQCAQGVVSRWRKITKDPNFTKLMLPTRYWGLTNPPFDVMPADAIRLNQIGNVILSALTANIPNTIVSYTVPFGFEGIINEHVNLFEIQSGPPFQSGSGALVWRIFINQYLATYYTAIQTQMGSLELSGGVRNSGGIRIKSNQTVTFSVIPTPAALAGGLDPAGQVICGFRGWIFPTY